jgi:Toprim domain
VLAAATRIPYCGKPLIPAWAALSSRKLAALPVIDGVERLLLLVDNDANQEGQKAAACVAAIWRKAERDVVPLMPASTDTDFNDIIIKDDDVAA